MKKFVLYTRILLVFSVLFFFAACGADGESGDVTLSLLSFGDNSSVDSAAFSVLLEEFQKENPNIKINEERLYDEAYHQKVQARIQSGDIPDILYAWTSPRSAPLYLSKQAVDLSQYIDTSKYVDKAVSPTSPMDGVAAGVYVLPITMGINSVLYANKKLLDGLGLAVPQTYEELKAMLPQIKAAGLEPVTMANSAAWVMNSTLFGTLTARITGNPNWLKEAMAGGHKFTDPEFIQVLDFVKTMYDDGVINKDSLRVDYGASLGLFMSQKAVFMIDGHWRLGAIAEDPELLKNIVMLPFPAVPGEQDSVKTASAGEPSPGYTITKKALEDENKKAAALKFIEFLVSERGGKVWAEQASFMPVLKGIDVESLGKYDLQVKSDFYQSVKTLANTPDQVLTSKVNETLNNGLQEIGLGSATPQGVAESMEKARN